MRRSALAASLVFLLAAAAAVVVEAQPRSLRTGGVGMSPKVVSVGTNALRYEPGETIIVTVRNGLAVPITATNGRTSCSIVSLDRRSGGTWVEVRNCYAGVPPESVRIGAGRTVRVQLRARLAPGSYRARLEYQARGHAARALSRPVLVG